MRRLKETSMPFEPPPRLPWALRAALVALVIPMGVRGQQRADLEKRIQRTVLANGLEVIVVPNPGVPLVTVEADVKNGSFTQTADYSGLSHLYEHMFFKANLQYPNPDDFVARASELGAEFNGSTTEEDVNYFVTLPADSAEGGMRFLADALIAPLFRPDELERERQVVLGEYDRDESNPGFRFQKAVDRALWGSAWSRKDPLGDRDVIARTTPDQMRTIERRYYVPNNTAIIITGDIDPSRAKSLATDIFGAWARGPDPFTANPTPPIPALMRDTALIVEEPINSVIVQLKWDGPSAGADPASTYAADVFSDVLNQAGSRFQRRLVDSRLFQSVGVNYYTLNHVGPITIEAETTPDKLLAGLAALNDELGKIAQPGYFTASDLEGIKQKRIVDTMLNLERSSGFAHQIGFWWAVTGLDYFFGYVDTMARQTPADLVHYATTYIVGKPHVTGVLLSSEARATIHLSPAALLSPGSRP